MQFTDWSFARDGRTHGIALQSLAERLFSFLVDELAIDPARAAEAIWADYVAGGRSDRLAFLNPFIVDRPIPRRRETITAGPARQRRHQSAVSQPETVSPPN